MRIGWALLLLALPGCARQEGEEKQEFDLTKGGVTILTIKALVPVPAGTRIQFTIEPNPGDPEEWMLKDLKDAPEGWTPRIGERFEAYVRYHFVHYPPEEPTPMGIEAIHYIRPIDR